MERSERRQAGTKPLRPDAMRCEDCGTTWFEKFAELAVRAGRRCRRCGGSLHTERRTSVISRAA